MPTCEIEAIKMAFNDNLKRLRRDKGLSQSELADMTGIKTTHISRLESENSDPKLSTIYKLMSALECSSDALLMDGEKIGINGVLQVTLERAISLPEMSKRAIIEVVDKYCIAVGIQKTMESQQGKISFLQGPTKDMISEIK